MDRTRLFSPSYRGMSSRSELWLMSLINFVLMLVLAADDETRMRLGNVVVFFFQLLFIFPLIIRRSRQMGAVWYGCFVLGYSLLPFVATCLLCCGVESEMLKAGIEETIFSYLALFVLLPLFFLGGSYAGRKNTLHRYAIAGERENCELFLEQFPSALTRRSEKGYSPRDYATMAGHRALAEWFREREAEQRAAE